MKMSVRIVGPIVHRPIDAVFEFVSNMENSPLWGRTTETTKTSDGPVEVGTLFLELADDDGRHLPKRTEVIEFDPPTTFSYRSRYDNGMSELARVSFETVGDGVRVIPEAEVEVPGVPQGRASAMSEEMQRMVLGLLENMREVLESPKG